MSDKDSIMAEQAIREYLEWMASEGYRAKMLERNRWELEQFLLFIRRKGMPWDEMFTLDTLNAFRKEKNRKHVPALRELSRYLFDKQMISQPIQRRSYPLPEIYEDYLLSYERSREVHRSRITEVRRLLSAFHEFVEQAGITLPTIRIEHIDAFLAYFTLNLAPGTSRVYRSFLRGFLRYLYQERKILPKDLAPLVVGAPLFAQAKPPKFLRPRELKTLFSSLTLTTPTDIRTYAMVHLAYFIGLRPEEIRALRLNDVCFEKRQVILRKRKLNNPTILPLPEKTLKAIAAYVLHARPNSKYRYLFLSFQTPYRPIGAGTVSHSIAKALKHSGIFCSPYSLRHTYAQNLLTTGATIYEIKEMLGHHNIQSTKRYLAIDIELMRKVLFDEEL